MLVTLRQAGRECNAHNQCTTYERGFWITPSRTVYTMAHSTWEKERKSIYITWVKLSTLEMRNSRKESQPFGFSRKSPYRGGARGVKKHLQHLQSFVPLNAIVYPLNMFNKMFKLDTFEFDTSSLLHARRLPISTAS